jgi:hypothetical protein
MTALLERPEVTTAETGEPPIAHAQCANVPNRAVCGELMLRFPPVIAPPDVERCPECSALLGLR